MKRSDKFYEHYAMVCQTITNPVRLKIIEILGDGKLNVSEIQNETGLPMSNLSNHLGSLFRMGVLKKDKIGNFVYYSLTDKSLLKIIDNMSDFVLKISQVDYK